MRKADPLIPSWIFVAILSSCLLFFSAAFCLPSKAAATSADSGVAVEEMMAGLSDEQVRQMLIAELKKDAEAEELEPPKMKGPAFLLSRLLRVLRSQHDDSESEVRALFGSLPTMGPDLYKVFVKL